MRDKRRMLLVQMLLAAAASLAASVSAGQAADLTPMIRIPAGSFVMGRDDGPDDERPAHRVDLPAFEIDRTPVTNRQFARFLDVVGPRSARGEPHYDVDDSDARIHRHGAAWQPDTGAANDPVVEASWLGARAYCAWVGRRLPTEAEWEKAARGPDGRRFPWGAEPPDATRAHFNGGWNDLRPVGSFPPGASPYGVLDMAGNGWQWVSSAYRPYPYDARDGREDPEPGPIRGTRGGGQDSRAEEITTTHRGRHVSRNPRAGHHNITFRCAR